MEQQYTCVLCNEQNKGYGNNPEPLASEGQCCNDCNIKVIVARFMTTPNEEFNDDDYDDEKEEEEDKDAMQCYSVKNIHRKEYCVGSGYYIIVDFDVNNCIELEQCFDFKLTKTEV